MGLDAFVRCNCFEEGKCTPPPKPFLSSDVYRDEEGYLCSRMLDGLRKKYDRRQFEARFLDLDRTFETWTDNSCEHEYGEYCSEWISNWAGVSEFQCLVGEINELTPLPLLSKIMPDGNGGSYPARLAHATLKELNTFTEHLGSVSMWALVSTKSNEPVWTCFEGSHFTWMFSPTKTVAMEGAEIIFRSKGCEIRTKRFLQIPRGTASDKEQPVERYGASGNGHRGCVSEGR